MQLLLKLYSLKHLIHIIALIKYVNNGDDLFNMASEQKLFFISYKAVSCYARWAVIVWIDSTAY